MVSLDNFRVEQCCAAQPPKTDGFAAISFPPPLHGLFFSPQLVQQHGTSPVGSASRLPNASVGCPTVALALIRGNIAMHQT